MAAARYRGVTRIVVEDDELRVRAEQAAPVVFVNQFYWPDEAATSQLLGDVVGEAARRGPVAVICGPAQYAPITGGQADGAEGVSIWRVRAGGFGHGKVQKLWSYASFVLGAVWRVAFGPRAGIMVTMTTPPLLGLLGWVGQLRGARHFIWEMDVYPDVAVELGVFGRGGFWDVVTGWLADFPRRRADGIIALGPCMEERLRRRGLGDVPIHVVHNWADGGAIRALPFLRDGLLKVFYSGNMGLAHDFETVIGALGLLGEGFLFRFSGGGPRRVWLESALAGLGFCEFRGYWGRGELEAAFGASDVGLVTQRAETIGTVVPSKVYGILAAGRGVIYVGPGESTVGRMIAEFGVGWQVRNGDGAGLALLLRELLARPEMVEETGRRARAVFEREFEKRGQVEKILGIIGV